MIQSREHAVRCVRCQRWTWREDALCDDCGETLVSTIVEYQKTRREDQPRMAITDWTRLDRQAAIVDIIKEQPSVLLWHIISCLPISVQDDLYDALHALEEEHAN